MPDTFGKAAAGLSGQSPGCLRLTVADLTKMRPNVLMKAGYMFGCEHDTEDLLFVGQVGKSPTMFYGTRVLQYENATDPEVKDSSGFHDE